ncbi:unnamed protein product [Linum tenue]|uniref:Homeobox domain-containing protein n=1 Tax=Linum tenue TaxID=586396 RepID=A0AAV0HPX3_9ROSI|nr:unnamed protein product [Linum tenue]
MEDDCHTRLGLGLSITGPSSPAAKQPIISNHNFFRDDREKSSSRKKKKKTTTSVACLDLSFKLFPGGDDDDDDDETVANDDDHDNNNGVVELATKSSSSIDTEEQQYYCSSGGGRKAVMDGKEMVGGGGRKKLRLSKEQSSLLESRFKLQTTLNTAQKQALAEQLKLTPRQVEVWFQNRRARTKLKQTEVDCEFLRKCCDSLSNENRRLKAELQELLRYGRNEPSPRGQASTATATCRSCQKRNVSSSGTASSSGAQPYHSGDNKP